MQRILTPLPKLKLWSSAEIDAAIGHATEFIIRNSARDAMRFRLLSVKTKQGMARVQPLVGEKVPISNATAREAQLQDQTWISTDEILLSAHGWPLFLSLKARKLHPVQ